MFDCKSTYDWLELIATWTEEDSLGKYLPEVAALKGISQPSEFHAEGDALTHVLLAIKNVAPGDDERLFWAVLLHDVGKSSTTRFIAGRWRSHGHDQKSAAMVPAILSRFGRSELAEEVSWLVRHHHFALSWGDVETHGLSARQKRFCSHPLFPLLIDLCRIDSIASCGTSSKGVLLENILECLDSDVASPLASYAIPNSYLREMGLFEMTKVQTGYLPQNY